MAIIVHEIRKRSGSERTEKLDVAQPCDCGRYQTWGPRHKGTAAQRGVQTKKSSGLLTILAPIVTRATNNSAVMNASFTEMQH